MTFDVADTRLKSPGEGIFKSRSHTDRNSGRERPRGVSPVTAGGPFYMNNAVTSSAIRHKPPPYPPMLQLDNDDLDRTLDLDSMDASLSLNDVSKRAQKPLQKPMSNSRQQPAMRPGSSQPPDVLSAVQWALSQHPLHSSTGEDLDLSLSLHMDNLDEMDDQGHLAQFSLSQLDEDVPETLPRLSLSGEESTKRGILPPLDAVETSTVDSLSQLINASSPPLAAMVSDHEGETKKSSPMTLNSSLDALRLSAIPRALNDLDRHDLDTIDGEMEDRELSSFLSQDSRKPRRISRRRSVKSIFEMATSASASLPAPVEILEAPIQASDSENPFDHPSALSLPNVEMEDDDDPARQTALYRRLSELDQDEAANESKSWTGHSDGGYVPVDFESEAANQPSLPILDAMFPQDKDKPNIEELLNAAEDGRDLGEFSVESSFVSNVDGLAQSVASSHPMRFSSILPKQSTKKRFSPLSKVSMDAVTSSPRQHTAGSSMVTPSLTTEVAPLTKLPSTEFDTAMGDDRTRLRRQEALLFSPGEFFAVRSGKLGDLAGDVPSAQRPHFFSPANTQGPEYLNASAMSRLPSTFDPSHPLPGISEVAAEAPIAASDLQVSGTNQRRFSVEHDDTPLDFGTLDADMDHIVTRSIRIHIRPQSDAQPLQLYLAVVAARAEEATVWSLEAKRDNGRVFAACAVVRDPFSVGNDVGRVYRLDATRDDQVLEVVVRLQCRLSLYAYGHLPQTLTGKFWISTGQWQSNDLQLDMDLARLLHFQCTVGHAHARLSTDRVTLSPMQTFALMVFNEGNLPLHLSARLDRTSQGPVRFRCEPSDVWTIAPHDFGQCLLSFDAAPSVQQDAHAMLTLFKRATAASGDLALHSIGSVALLGRINAMAKERSMQVSSPVDLTAYKAVGSVLEDAAAQLQQQQRKADVSNSSQISFSLSRQSSQVTLSSQQPRGIQPTPLAITRGTSPLTGNQALLESMPASPVTRHLYNVQERPSPRHYQQQQNHPQTIHYENVLEVMPRTLHLIHAPKRPDRRRQSIRVMNRGDSTCSFDVLWPAYRFQVVPAYGDLSPGESVTLTVDLDATYALRRQQDATSVCQIMLMARGGSQPLECIDVTISSDWDPARTLVLPLKQAALTLDRFALALPDTVVGTTSHFVVTLYNIDAKAHSWRLVALNNSSESENHLLKVLCWSQQQGQLAAGCATDLVITFAPTEETLRLNPSRTLIVKYSLQQGGRERELICSVRMVQWQTSPVLGASREGTVSAVTGVRQLEKEMKENKPVNGRHPSPMPPLPPAALQQLVARQKRHKKKTMAVDALIQKPDEMKVETNPANATNSTSSNSVVQKQSQQQPSPAVSASSSVVANAKTRHPKPPTMGHETPSIVLTFPETKVGRHCERALRLCNAHDYPISITLDPPTAPFRLVTRTLTLRARSYVLLPVIFAPTRADSFECITRVYCVTDRVHWQVRFKGMAPME